MYMYYNTIIIYIRDDELYFKLIMIADVLSVRAQLLVDRHLPLLLLLPRLSLLLSLKNQLPLTSLQSFVILVFFHLKMRIRV